MPLTNQKAFTKIVEHCLAQEARSYDELQESCVYAGPNGGSCAVGCLLPREVAEQLDKKFPSTLWDAVLENSRFGVVRKAKTLLKGVDTDLLSQCQRVHDMINNRDEASLRELQDHFKDIANDYRLKMPKCTK